MTWERSIYAALLGLAIMAIVALLLAPSPFPGTILQSDGEGKFIRCAPHHYINRSPPPDCPPAHGYTPVDPPRRPYDPAP